MRFAEIQKMLPSVFILLAYAGSKYSPKARNKDSEIMSMEIRGVFRNDPVKRIKWSMLQN